jgi:hypothetical protein
MEFGEFTGKIATDPVRVNLMRIGTHGNDPTSKGEVSERCPNFAPQFKGISTQGLPVGALPPSVICNALTEGDGAHAEVKTTLTYSKFKIKKRSRRKLSHRQKAIPKTSELKVNPSHHHEVPSRHWFKVPLQA